MSVPSTTRALLALAAIKLGVRIAGVRRCLTTLDRLAPLPRQAHSSPPSAALADALAHRVAVAGALYPGRALCLEQSLLLYALLRRAGVAATFRLGVRPRPFEAHAWVEIDGRPVREDAERLARFLALPELPELAR